MAKLTETSSRAVITLDSDGVLQVLERLSVKADQPTASTWQITMHRGELFAQPSLVVDGRRYHPVSVVVFRRARSRLPLRR